MDKAIKSGFKQGQEHSQPSPITRKLIKNMEDKFDNLKDKVHSIETNVISELGNMKTDIVKEINDAINCVKKDSDKKYAPAWVATALKSMMGVVAAAMIMSIMNIILK